MSDKIDRRAFVSGGVLLAGAALLSTDAEAAKKKRKVVVWSEGTAPKKIYPKHINTAIAEGLKPLKGWDVVIANLDDPDQGLPDSLLNSADVLIWWGHERHGEVKDELVQRIVKRVKEDGMGFLPTHAAHYSKALKAVLGTNCGWSHYVDDGSKLTLLVKAPNHPICKGVTDFVVPHTERYGDPFQVPTPEAVLFDGLYNLPNGTTENAQQGMVWTVGKGRVFYFQPGHEAYPIYFQEEIRHIMRNGVEWVAKKK